MNTKKYIVVTIVIIGVVIALALALKTRPTVQEESNVQRKEIQAMDPLSAPLIAHMRDDDGIDIGPDTSHALAIMIEGEQIRVVVSDRLKEKLGADLLERLGMVENEKQMSWDGYQRFLNDLHNIIIVAEGGEHHHHHGDHDHDASKGENTSDPSESQTKQK